MRKNESAWIQTFSGVKYYPLEPLAEDVRLEDIAHALSLVCRFGGHCKQFYSVAEHSIRCCEYVNRKCLLTRSSKKHILLAALMHDAAESFLADISRPVKKTMRQFSDIEDLNIKAIAEKFQFGYPWNEEVEYWVKRADNVMLATEARDLMAPPPEKWLFSPEPPDDHWIVPMTSQEAERTFLALYDELTQ